MRVLFTIIGVFAVVVGAVGVVLPVLPTTPFLLLALICFSKGSERMRNWFRGTPLYKKYLQEYMQRKPLTLKQKIFIQLFAGAMMLISFIATDSRALRLVLIACFIAHNYVFMSRNKNIR